MINLPHPSLISSLLWRPQRAATSRFLPVAWRLLGALGIVSLAPSCASRLNSTYTEDVLNHAIVVKSDGCWADPRDKLVDAPVTTRANDAMDLDSQLRRIEDKLKANPPTAEHPLKILVFVHGGLHSWATSCDTYRCLRRPMEDAGFYPIFIIWDSDLYSSYGDHLWRVRQGEDSPYLAPFTSVFVLPIDLATAFARTPIVWSSELRTDLRTTEWKDSPQQRDHDAVEKFLTTNQPDSLRLGRDYRTFRERAYYGISYGVMFAPKLAVSPIVDGLGSKAWDVMLRRTQTMFHPPDRVDIYTRLAAERNFIGLEDPTGLPGGDRWRDQIIGDWYKADPKGMAAPIQSEPVGAMWRFSRQLREWSQQDHVEVQLFGHSMGTIVLNELIRQVPDLRVTRIGYLAAACTIADWQTSVLRYLRSPTGLATEFYSVSLHRMREQSERNPGSLFDLAPRGSLLDWIDNFLSNPATISSRTLGSWENITRVVPQFASDHDGRTAAETDDSEMRLLRRIHLHCLDAADISFLKPENSQPQKHGDFTEWPFWDDNFLWPAANAAMPVRLRAPNPADPMPPTKY